MYGNGDDTYTVIPVFGRMRRDGDDTQTVIPVFGPFYGPKYRNLRNVKVNTPMKLDTKKVIDIVKSALKEDVGMIDITTSTLVNNKINARADILAKEDGVIAGLPIVEAVFRFLDKDIRFKPQVNEGDKVSKSKAVCYLEGPAHSILTGERTALNFLGRLSGIATQTQKFVEKVKPYNVKIMDTRKTTPGLRYLEKYAVGIGGGHNHRMGLWDQVLIKDNHLKVVSRKSLVVSKLIKEVRKKIQKNIKIEIETASLQEFKDALKGRPDIIMLDNMATEDIKNAVKIRNAAGNIPLLEVSGNITLDNIEEYAKCNPDIISIGFLTHSVKSLDVSLEIYGKV